MPRLTNEEAIKILALECEDWETSHCSPMVRREAFDMAIEALKQSEPQEQFRGDTKMMGPEPCEDCISRQSAVDEIEEWIENYDGEGEKPERDALKHAAKSIKKLPSVTPKSAQVSVSQCEDAISRQAAIDLLKRLRKDGDMIPWEGKDVFKAIRALPSV